MTIGDKGGGTEATRRAAARRPRAAAPGPAPAASVSGMGPMLEAKLWRNPCWFSFRLNYMALRYNLPLYDWVRRTYGLSRPEYVVVYSLGLEDGGSATDIVRTSGFPKNTLSRAVKRLEGMGLIVRGAAGAGRTQALHLSEAGRRLFGESAPAFEAHEARMLAALSAGERATLSRLMAKMVLSADDWPDEIPDGPRAASGAEGGNGR